MRFLVLLLALAATASAGAPAQQRKLVTITAKTIELADPIYFATGKADIKSESFQELDALAAALTADKHITLVEIGVHTDARGTSEFNRAISQQRADAVMKYLVDKGIDAKRLRPIGYGETRPLDKHSNAAAWARNRRTELVILQRMT
jgi:outer membrane protein OmpA-like peptidoglycan-associated protein